MPEIPDTSHSLTGPFWQAASEHRLSLPNCDQCSRLVWYPEKNCPTCSGELEWTNLSGKGNIVAFSVVHRPLFPNAKKWVPYIPALVSITEDPKVRLVSQIVDCDPAQVQCDLPVDVCYRSIELPDGGKYTAPLFKLS